ncbi:hypothetical protein A2483_05110 [Candidatus Peregrinibacteria bacterium RIFOXYC2_FULL_33_13]|nr:MAG: hypothetical protein UR27_C0015G0044 [Candidatus Peregrinibacteria bacterium GW2011_GWA2_33_10]KKP39546.1 MAG: hypothetical protein UR30_C0010G0042 [Candidatus Peregrinibacteria bacterium GW2011_GWC2_33_13]OGJ55268.1 MAG: hypothetical protein A2483_05110 [Candidatus Peregrinibacteria bacterium RIFOXYC2_FULL_33_13]
MNNKNIFQKLGSVLAYIQQITDNLFTIGFKKLKKIGQKGENVELNNKKLNFAFKIGKRLLKGIGEFGDSFYSTYAKLKNKKNNKK